jgi:CHRD domain
MDRRVLSSLLMLGSLVAASAYAQNGQGRNLTADLRGFNEVPLAINSPGSGAIDVQIDESAGTIGYTLSYSGVTTPVTQAHIHFGQRHVAGGIIAFLCSNLPTAPAGTPACPQFEGTVSGTIAAGNVIAQEQQNIAAGDFAALVSALLNRAAYANVHTTRFPAGELRGQLHRADRDKAQ